MTSEPPPETTATWVKTGPSDTHEEKPTRLTLIEAVRAIQSLVKDWATTMEALAKLVAFAGVLVLVPGFAIVLWHFQKIGIASFDILRIQYFWAGVWLWLFLLAVTISTVFLIAFIHLAIWSKASPTSQRTAGIIALILAGGFAIA